MRRSFWITLTISIAICAIVVMGQAAKTKSLTQRLADEQAKQKISESPRERSGFASPDSKPSQESIERALTAVISLQPNVLEISPILAKKDLSVDDQLKIDRNEIEAAYAKIFPDFLRSVQGLNADELIAVANRIPDPGTGDSLGRPRTRKWLLLLAAEKDPMRIYRNEALMAGVSDSEILEVLGRKNPAAVLQRLPPMKKQTSEPSSGGIRMTSLLSDWALASRIRSGTRLLGTDLEEGLEVLSQVHENYLYIPPSKALGTTPLPPGAIPGLIAAMERPEFAGMRDDFIKMILRDTIYDSGVTAAAQRVETMPITGRELNSAIDDLVGDNIMESEPEAMIDWISEVRPGKVPPLISKWAETDLKSASDWFVQQEPSPVRDKALAGFAMEASGVDRDAAAAWAREIGDEQLREEILLKVSDK